MSWHIKTLQQPGDTIQDPKEPIETDLQTDGLIIKTGKSNFWLFISMAGIIYYHDPAAYYLPLY